MKFFRIFIIAVIAGITVAQSKGQDTLPLAECKATYPIIGSVEDLQFVPDVQKWHYCYNVKNQRYPLPRTSDTIYYYRANQIYGDNYEISYLENNGLIRLEYVLLKKNRKFKMNFFGRAWSDGLTLKYNIYFKDLLKYFNRSAAEVDIDWNRGGLMLGNKFKNIWHFTVTYFTGEPYYTQISLTFNKHKRLLIIEMDYYDPEMLKIGSMIEDSVF
jgi:hypothetical protein